MVSVGKSVIVVLMMSVIVSVVVSVVPSPVMVVSVVGSLEIIITVSYVIIVRL